MEKLESGLAALNSESVNVVSLLVAVTALVVAVIALVYAIRAFWLKAGEKVRFSYCITSSTYTEDKYISSYTIENLKDKALVVFDSYLQFGNSAYLILEEFEDSPLIIPPFEAYQKILDPVIFYSVSMKRVKIDHLINNDEVKTRLVLSTTNGKIRVRSFIRRWSPMGEFFRNWGTAIIQPRYLSHKGKRYGSKIQFLIEIITSNGNEEIIPVQEDDYRRSVFAKFRLTQEALSGKENLEEFLSDKVTDGTVDWKSFEIIEFRNAVEQMVGFSDKEPINITNRSWLAHHVTARILTWWKQREMDKNNRRKVK